MVFSFGVVDVVLISNTTLSITKEYFAVIDISYVHIRLVEQRPRFHHYLTIF